MIFNDKNYLITLNSVAPNEENLEDGITELTFLNNGNNNSSLKIQNNINAEENLISKALLFDHRPSFSQSQAAS